MLGPVVFRADGPRGDKHNIGIRAQRREHRSLDTGAGVHQDSVWIYRSPLAESQKITGLACFYNEKVDLYLDGVLQQRPHTKFS